MVRNFLTIAVLGALLFTSCKDTTKEETIETTTVETVEQDDIVTNTSTDKDGKQLEMSFNNTKGTATLNFQGETIVLDQERAASGIWYKNDNYELRGKGDDIVLTKDGVVVFEHEDDKVTVDAKSNNGQTLNLVFNNTDGTVKAYLNGGEQIDLVEKKSASGIWYNNENYELSGKDDKYKLTKDGKTVFEN